MSDDIGAHTSPHRHQVDMCSCVGVHIFVDVGVDIVVDMHRVIRCRQKENVKVGMEGCNVCVPQCTRRHGKEYIYCSWGG